VSGRWQRCWCSRCIRSRNLPAGVEAVLPFVARGYLGVDFFFVLSGYIITHVYFASLASANFDAVRIFLWHRFVRLYPVHITVLAGLVAVVSLQAPPAMS
jgi:peptidoglycan/LPS O-acetylase OafA/YrhL